MKIKIDLIENELLVLLEVVKLIILSNSIQRESSIQKDNNIVHKIYL